MTPIFVVHISSGWVKISLHTEFQLPILPESRAASFRLLDIYKLYYLLTFYTQKDIFKV